MKTDRKIQLVTDETVNIEDIPMTETEAEIDALLRMTADESTAEVDFDRIRRLAVEGARTKLARRNKIRKAIGGGLIAAAAVMLCFSVLSVLNVFGGRNAGPNSAAVDAYVSDIPSKEWNTENATQEPVLDNVRPVEDGIVSSETYNELRGSVSELIPEELQIDLGNAKKNVDPTNSSVSITGSDKRGGALGYSCTICDGVSDELEVGQVGTVQEGDELIYFWQMNEDHYMMVRFTGFQKKDADRLFDSLTKRITGGEDK